MAHYLEGVNKSCCPEQKPRGPELDEVMEDTEACAADFARLGIGARRKVRPRDGNEKVPTKGLLELFYKNHARTLKPECIPREG